jgi:hypothetical protein
MVIVKRASDPEAEAERQAKLNREAQAALSF